VYIIKKNTNANTDHEKFSTQLITIFNFLTYSKCQNRSWELGG